jgi:hypothetical protein
MQPLYMAYLPVLVRQPFNPVLRCWRYNYPQPTKHPSYQAASKFIIYFDCTRKQCICLCINNSARSCASSTLVSFCWFNKSFQTQHTTIFLCFTVLTLHSNSYRVVISKERDVESYWIFQPPFPYKPAKEVAVQGGFPQNSFGLHTLFYHFTTAFSRLSPPLWCAIDLNRQRILFL